LGFAPDRTGADYEEVPQFDPICIPANDTVVVTFVTRGSPAEMPRRGETSLSLPFRLHALFVNTQSGQVRTTREWPTGLYSSRVLPGTEGRFIVLTADKLMLYSPQMELLKELDLSLTRRSVLGWRAHLSPSRKTLVVGYEPREDESRSLGEARTENQWIDTESLTVTQRWTAKGFSGDFDNISDRAFVGILPGIKIRELNAPWRQLCGTRTAFCGDHPQFISNSVILTRTDPLPRYISLFRTNGALLFKQDFPPSEVFQCRQYAGPNPARPSADGRRFALPVGRLHGGSRFLDIGAKFTLKQIMVFDLASNGWIARVECKPLRVTSLWGLALSPDGSQLAFIDQDGVLWLFRIPEVTTVPSA
jgi:hypothetical protein